ncbi:hypothetical protein Taro_040530 [Colocasia esculenta]|uniref:Leucine-rich repeat-containing N-terminal plant-type domain-containing protein n=1 Tax=Colocasia esculenta TaxID=4460 RepID=A0A843WUU0_COLES|nr:hypothetical protein [Colocasia esculenta]
MEYRQISTLSHVVMWLLLSHTCYGTESDVMCLRKIKKSLKDPIGYLASSWNFSNIVEGSICTFSGVECWHPDENKVLNLRLSNMGLEGQFPSGLENCTSMTGLDLSNNNLSGLIPADICTRRIHYVTTLDLSSNHFSGGIPLDMGNCSYLNALSLQHNQLNGSIPQTLSQLSRLRSLNVAYNSLTGLIPILNPNISANFTNNRVRYMQLIFWSNSFPLIWPLFVSKQFHASLRRKSVFCGVVSSYFD